MDAVSLAKIQFFLTIGFHFIFVPITIGLAWFNVWFMTKYMRTKDQYYKDIAWFWNKVFLISVAIGIPTGVVMEFQFGTNWAEFSRFVGEVFGPALAMEVIFAFYMESIFLGVLFTGWNSKKISEKVLWVATLMVAIGATFSAFFILSAGSWMHTPAGYELVEGGTKIILTDLWAALLSPSLIPRFFHTFTACMITGAFFIIGISSWYLLKNQNQRFAKESITLALIVAFVASIAQGVIGHFHSVQVALTQPAKFASQEAHFVTQSGAPLTVFAIITDAGVIFSIAIPFLLSLMTYGNPNATVTGLDAFPVSDRPNLFMTFYSFHFMVYLGAFFILFAAGGLFLIWRKKLFEEGFIQKWFIRVGVLSTPLPIIANELGWITTEVGRQPWIVQDILRTNDAVSIVVPAEQILFSLILFAMIFALLFSVWLFLLLRMIKQGPKFNTTPSTTE
jgi:cytochrome d ubiquinol oxidase subunit I